MLNKFTKAIERAKKEEGFTLIELLVVVLIIGVLSAIVVLAVSNSTGDAKSKACTNNALNVYDALDTYKVSNGVSQTFALVNVTVTSVTSETFTYAPAGTGSNNAPLVVNQYVTVTSTTGSPIATPTPISAVGGTVAAPTFTVTGAGFTVAALTATVGTVTVTTIGGAGSAYPTPANVGAAPALTLAAGTIGGASVPIGYEMYSLADLVAFLTPGYIKTIPSNYTTVSNTGTAATNITTLATSGGISAWFNPSTGNILVAPDPLVAGCKGAGV